MTLWTVFGLAYLASTLFALGLTWREQQSRGQGRLLYSLIGYLACTVWPLVALVFVVMPEAQASEGMRDPKFSKGRLPRKTPAAWAGRQAGAAKVD